MTTTTSDAPDFYGAAARVVTSVQTSNTTANEDAHFFAEELERFFLAGVDRGRTQSADAPRSGHAPRPSDDAPKVCRETGYPCNCEAKVRGYWCSGSIPKERATGRVPRDEGMYPERWLAPIGEANLRVGGHVLVTSGDDRGRVGMLLSWRVAEDGIGHQVMFADALETIERRRERGSNGGSATRQVAPLDLPGLRPPLQADRGADQRTEEVVLDEVPRATEARVTPNASVACECICGPDEQNEWCHMHGRLDDLAHELENYRTAARERFATSPSPHVAPRIAEATDAERARYVLSMLGVTLFGTATWLEEEFAQVRRLTIAKCHDEVSRTFVLLGNGAITPAHFRSLVASEQPPAARSSPDPLLVGCPSCDALSGVACVNRTGVLPAGKSHSSRQQRAAELFGPAEPAEGGVRR